MLTYLLTYLLTPWSKVLLQKLTGFGLVKKFPAFYGTQKFITAFTSARQLSLSWASSNQSLHPHSTSWRSILILSSRLRLGLPSCLFPSGFPTKTLYTSSSPPYALHATPITFFWILSPWKYRMSSTDRSAPHYAVSSTPLLPRPSYAQIFSSAPCSRTPSAFVPPSMSATKFHTRTKQQAEWELMWENLTLVYTLEGSGWVSVLEETLC